MAHKANNFSITSIRTALTGGVSIIIILTSGLVGTISIWGGLDSAIKLTRRNQAIKTSELSKELKNFEESIIREASTLSQVIGRSAEKLEEKEIIDILSAYSEHKESLTSITLVRKNRTNVWVGRWRGNVIHEINTELDDESWEIAINAVPNDEWEGFDDIYIEPSEGRPVISYTKHIANRRGNLIGTIYIDLGLKILSNSLLAQQESSSQKTFVFNSKGSIIAHPSLREMKAYKKFKQIPTVQSLSDPIPLAIYNKISLGHKDIQEVKVDNIKWLVSMAINRNIGDAEWYIVSIIPQDAVLGPAIQQAKFVTLISLLIMSLAISYSQFIGRNITGSLEFLASSAGAIQKLKLNIKSHNLSFLDELKITEQAFISMGNSMGVFAKYVPKILVQKLIEIKSSGSSINAEEREVTILFTDIAGYTTISDGMVPAELATLLNEYFEILVSVILEHHGTIDKFIGDAIMVFWNAPDIQTMHPDLSIKCALEIQKKILEFNQQRAQNKLPPLKTRIGIHTGTVLAGEIGSSQRMNYTIVGDSVNTAARLEALGKEIDETLCISGETKMKCQDVYAWKNVGNIILRGRKEQTEVYTIKSSLNLIDSKKASSN